MGAIMRCVRCGFRIREGVPGHGLWFKARREASEFFKGKKPTNRVMEKKSEEIYEKLKAEYLEAQREEREGHEFCTSIWDVLLFRKSTARHQFKCIAEFD
ncbi:MAG: hypothetical protein PHF60_05440 [Candidatus ainarchaeum sp.]|nr:hypothetical protein [Candidatus ainarchaeum sp.]